MNSTSRIALGLALVLGAAVAAAPVVAQQQSESKQPQRKVSRQAQKQIVALQEAAKGTDDAAFQAALAAAEAAARSEDDRYYIGQFMLARAQQANDTTGQLAAIERLIASGGASPEELSRLHKAAGQLAYNAKDMTRAQTNLNRAVELNPNDYEVYPVIAQIHAAEKRPTEAIATLQRGIEMARAANQQVPENWYQVALRFAYDANLTAESVKTGQALVAANPSQTNWRDALLVYREVAKLDRPAAIDLLRLMRTAKALSSENDYYELADALNNSGLPGETKAVLEEGIAARTIDGNKPVFKEMLALANSRVQEDRASLAGLESKAASAANGTAALNTADAYLGYGDYAKAATLYRTALQKGSVDANLVNTRLGMALALAGQRAEAETALKAVTGPRADIASYWMLWLAQRA